jgi:hypothetical protein
VEHARERPCPMSGANVCPPWAISPHGRDSVPAAWGLGCLVASDSLRGLGVALSYTSGIAFLMAAASPEAGDHAFAANAAVGPLSAFLGSLPGGALPGILPSAAPHRRPHRPRRHCAPARPASIQAAKHLPERYLQHTTAPPPSEGPSPGCIPLDNAVRVRDDLATRYSRVSASPATSRPCPWIARLQPGSSLSGLAPAPCPFAQAMPSYHNGSLWCASSMYAETDGEMRPVDAPTRPALHSQPHFPSSCPLTQT